MKCCQCDRVAMYGAGEKGQFPLCLDCWNKLQSAHYMQFLINAAGANQALDDMDMITGFRTPGGRIPVAELARAIVKGPVHNSFKISNSSVGVINTGDLARITAVVDLSKTTEVEDVGQKIQALTQAVIDASDIAANDKRDLIELIEGFAEQASVEKASSGLGSVKVDRRSCPGYGQHPRRGGIADFCSPRSIRKRLSRT